MKNEFEIYLDELTGLKNRRFLFERGEEILKEWGEGSFIIFDLDNFKQINDKFGHLAGDEVLRGVAKCLYTVTQGEEKELIRYAGDEFVILLKAKDKDFLKEKSEKLLESIKNFPYRINIPREEIHIGASIGITVFPDDGRTIAELFEKADSALYFGKRRGKFQYRFYSEVEDEIKKEKFLKEKSTPEEIVNREKEIKEIMTFIQHPVLPIHIKGTHGIGKTRILNYVVESLIKEGKKYIFVSFKEDLKDVPFSTFCELLNAGFEEVPFELKRKIDNKEIDFIIADDVEYIDEYSNKFLKEISDEFKGIITAGTVPVEWKVKEIELNSLKQNEVIEYIQKLLPEAEIDNEFKNWILEISKGVPYIIEECIRYAVFKEWIVIQSGKFILREFPEKRPRGIESIYMEKIKSLDKELKNFIISLSVLGKSFKISVAAKYIGINPGRFIDLADKGVEFHILEPYGRDGYAFINENFRKFIYEKLSDDAKTKLHRRIAEIAKKLKEIPEEVLTGTLAFHSKLAGETKEAMEASAKLAELAKRLEEREDIKKLLEKRKILKRKEVPYTPPPEDKDFPKMRECLIALFGAVESYRIYPENSRIVIENIERFKNLINKLLKERKSFTISVYENNLIVDGVQFPNQRLHAVEKIRELINEFEIQSISFVYEVNEEEIKNLLSIFSKRPSDVKKEGGVENLKESETLENIIINQKVYVALGDELEAIKKIPEDTEKRIKNLLEAIKAVPERSEEWIERLNEIIKDLKSEDIRELFISLPEDEKVLKSLSNLKTEEALKIRDTLEKELEKMEKEENVEGALKIRKILKFIPEREEILKKEREKIFEVPREELLKEENKRIIKEILPELSEEEKTEIFSRIAENLSDPSLLMRRKTLEFISQIKEKNEEILFKKTLFYIKKEKDEEVIREFVKLFFGYMKEAIKKGIYEEVQDFAEMILKIEDEEIEKEFLECLKAKYVEIRKSDKKDEMLRIRVLFRILESVAIPYLFEEVEKEPLLSDLVKEMLKERVKGKREYIEEEIKKEKPFKTLEIFFDTIIDEKINISPEIMRRFLNHPSEKIRAKSLEAMIINNLKESTKMLSDILEKGNENEKINAIRLIGKYKIKELIPVLLKFIEKRGRFSPEPPLSVVRETLIALSNFNEVYEVGDALIEALKPEGVFSSKRTKPQEVRILILRTLRNFEPTEEWLKVIENLTKESNVGIKSTAKLLLSEWKKKL